MVISKCAYDLTKDYEKIYEILLKTHKILIGFLQEDKNRNYGHYVYGGMTFEGDIVFNDSTFFREICRTKEEFLNFCEKYNILFIEP